MALFVDDTASFVDERASVAGAAARLVAAPRATWRAT
jgi:hypothetical protein